MSLYLDLNAIQTYGPNCLNRDDANLPKTVVYGGKPRARISSQALKRAIREATDLMKPKTRSMRTIILPRLIADGLQHHDPTLDDKTAMDKALNIVDMLGLSVNTKDGEPTLKVAVFLGADTLDRIIGQATEPEPDADTLRNILEGDLNPDVALYGRMSAENKRITVDGAVQMAHAIGVAPMDMQFDYYTLKDDMRDGGAPMMDTIAFDAATFHRYATVNLPQLEARLGHRTMVDTILAFTRAFALAAPSGRNHGFAHHTTPSLLMADLTHHPLSRVGAYATPCEDTPEAAIQRLNQYEPQAADWGITPQWRRLIGAPEDCLNLTDSGRWASGSLDQLSDALAHRLEA